jgi:hypothetical protein
MVESHSLADKTEICSASPENRPERLEQRLVANYSLWQIAGGEWLLIVNIHSGMIV